MWNEIISNMMERKKWCEKVMWKREIKIVLFNYFLLKYF